jgi:hypothetical protein
MEKSNEIMNKETQGINDKKIKHLRIRISQRMWKRLNVVMLVPCQIKK